MGNYIVTENTIILNNKEINFKYQIESVVEINEKYIVLLINRPYSKAQLKNNVYALDKNGRILWQMQDPLSVFPFKEPGICIEIGVDKQNRLYAITHVGIIYYLNLDNGKIIERSFSK